MRTNFGRLTAAFAALTLFALASGAHAGDRSSLTSEKGLTGEQTYLEIELENVQITSYQLGGSGDPPVTADSGEHPDQLSERE